jgi:hypothetical protein
MTSARVLLGAAVLAALAGCGSSQEEPDRQLNSYRRAMREQLRANEKFLGILAGVKDEASMVEALKQLDKSQGEFDRAAARLQKLWPPPPQIKEQLRDDYNRLAEAKNRMLEEIRRIRPLPGGEAFFQAVEALSKQRQP